MFNNIGGKIKGLAKFLCWAGIIICVILGFMFIAGSNAGYYYYYSREAMIVFGVLIMVGGSIISWLSSLFLYGFGELVENTSIIRRKMDD